MWKQVLGQGKTGKKGLMAGWMMVGSRQMERGEQVNLISTGAG
jgi:hypothetical protein